ncbi:MAG: hypothetical protein ACK568_03655, partial [Pseudanabaena sp.]
KKKHFGFRAPAGGAQTQLSVWVLIKLSYLKMGNFFAKGREAIVEVYSIDDSLASQKSDFYNLKQEIKKQLELIGKQTLEPCKQRKTLFMLYDR